MWRTARVIRSLGSFQGSEAHVRRFGAQSAQTPCHRVRVSWDSSRQDSMGVVQARPKSRGTVKTSPVERTLVQERHPPGHTWMSGACRAHRGGPQPFRLF